MSPVSNSVEAQRAYTKIAWRLLPFLFLCYAVAMIDRLNVGYAKLQFLADLHFDEAAFGQAAGALYVGYILFEIPSNLMLERIGARKTLLRIMTLWGVIAMALAFAGDRWSFSGLRFLLGAGEAGFFPGVLFYLTLWFPSAWRARITSAFALAVPLSGFLGAPVSSWIMIHLAGVQGLNGWQWLFLITGAPAILLGVGAYAFLPDRPEDARFLSAAEKTLIAGELKRDAREVGANQSGFVAALSDPRLYALGFVYFAFYSTQSVLLLWVPTLLRQSGVAGLSEIGARASLISLAGAVGMALVAWHSDRAGERRLHLIACGLVASAALASLSFAAHRPDATTALLMVASAAIFSYLALFWTVPGSVLGPKARAGGIALVSSLGASGSALSPTFLGWMQVQTGSLYGAILGLVTLFLSSLVVLWMTAPGRAGNLPIVAGARSA
jgi:sugar phosphate permease